MPESEKVNVWLSGEGSLLLVLAVAMILGFILYRRLRASRRARTEAPTASVPDVLRCVCGEPATHPAPILRRSRTDWFRAIFAAPPRYRRTIEALAIPEYCTSHAHLADVLLDKFIFETRREQADGNARIAAKAAQFEQEGLHKAIEDSLTDDQKRAAKRLSQPVRLVANGGS